MGQPWPQTGDQVLSQTGGVERVMKIFLVDWEAVGEWVAVYCIYNINIHKT